jgi:hypothetical protein
VVVEEMEEIGLDPTDQMIDATQRVHTLADLSFITRAVTQPYLNCTLPVSCLYLSTVVSSTV